MQGNGKTIVFFDLLELNNKVKIRNRIPNYLLTFSSGLLKKPKPQDENLLKKQNKKKNDSISVSFQEFFNAFIIENNFSKLHFGESEI